MPRPAPLALRRASAASLPAVTAPCPCSCRAKSIVAAPYSTAASSAAPARATAPPPPPVLDFLAPGFGFFSRALPPLVAPAARAPTSAHPPAPAQRPLQPALAPHPRHPFAAPPPPPPLPQHHQFDVRAWRPLATTATAAARMPGAPLRRSAIPLPGACVCGRVRQSCLRCRGKSTSAAGPLRVGGAQQKREGEAKERSRKDRFARLETARPPPVPPEIANARLRALLDKHAPSILAHVRGGTLPARSPTPSRRKSHKNRLTEKHLSIAQARASLAALTAAANDDEFYHSLTAREQLDLVRAFSSVSRAVRPFASPDPLSSGAPGDDAARTALRHLASRRMLALLRRSRAALTAFASLGTSPYSHLRQSAALLLLDAVTLADALGTVGQVLLGGGDDGSAEAVELAAALETLFRPVSFDAAAAAAAAAAIAEGVVGRERSRARDEANHVENQRTAFALLLQLWRAPSHLSHVAAEQALAFVTAYPPASLEWLFEAYVSKSNATHRNQDAYNDVLRRGYGSLLATLEPSPSAWLDLRSQGRPLVETERTAGHLVRFLAEAGHPIPALEVFQLVERLREEAGAATGADDSVSDAAERIHVLSALILGLTRDRLFDDARPLAVELERRAAALQADADTALASTPLEVGIKPAASFSGALDRVAEAYRTLAKLASDQGRSATLERLLGRLARLGVSKSSAEPVARRMRVPLARQELGEVRAAFARANLAQESAESRARLWGQLIVAHVRVNDVEGGIRTLQELLDAGLLPTLPAINSLLHGYARRGHPKPAYDLFGQLADGAFAPLRPDAMSWNALVLAHTTARDPAAAQAAVASMKFHGVEPTRQTWTTLMSAYVENSAWAAAFDVYRYLDSHPDPALRPDTPVANTMLKACILTGTPGKTVLSLFKQFVSHGVRPDMVTYTLVLQSLCTAGMMPAAEDLYRLIDSGEHAHTFASRGRIKPDVFVFSALMAGYARRGDAFKARACLSEMRSRGMEPSSVTVATIVAMRLASYTGELTGARLTDALRLATAQARALLDEATAENDSTPEVVKRQRSEALERRRTRQPVRADRPLAAGTEAIAVFGPVLRSLAMTGDPGEALALFEEILERTESSDSEPPIALYTVLMSAFRQGDAPLEQLQAEAAARNVHVVWKRLYDTVARQYVRLQPVGPVDPATGLAPRERRVEPAHAGVLCLPLTNLLEAARRAGMHMLVEPTWRRLAREGFVFDASNWNALALYFIHDMQLERALWITEHVLCEPMPLEDLARGQQHPGADVPDFVRELAAIRRADAVGRTPARLWAARLAAHDMQRPRSHAQLLAYLQSLRTGSQPSARDGTLADELGSALASSHARQSATLWHPYGRTLDELQTALDTLSADGTVRVERKYEARLARTDLPHPPGAAEFETARPEAKRLSPQEAADVRRDWQQRHPKTMRALYLWRTRHERLVAEQAVHAERLEKGF